MSSSTPLPPDRTLPEDLSSLGLPASVLLLLDKLRFFYCRARPFCWPSDNDLARRTGLSIHQVRRGLRRLEQSGLIARQRTTRCLDGGRLLRRRFIDLRFVEPGAGAQPDQAPAPTTRQAPARTQEEVVVVEGQRKSEGPDPGLRERQRPGAGMPPPCPPGPPAPAAPQQAQGLFQGFRPPVAGPTADEPPRLSRAAAPTIERPGEAMARVFGRLGVEPPPLTPAVDQVPGPRSSQSAPTPAGQEVTRRPRPTLTTETLEQLAAGGDPILAGELARRQATRERREAAAAIPPPASTAELLGRIREDPIYVSRAAQALAVELNDERSWRGLHAICKRAFEGELEPAALVHALGKAQGPKVRKPGAIFTLEVGRWKGP